MMFGCEIVAYYPVCFDSIIGIEFISKSLLDAAAAWSEALSIRRTDNVENKGPPLGRGFALNFVSSLWFLFRLDYASNIHYRQTDLQNSQCPGGLRDRPNQP
jgi:hypothetical protein